MMSSILEILYFYMFEDSTKRDCHGRAGLGKGWARLDHSGCRLYDEGKHL